MGFSSCLNNLLLRGKGLVHTIKPPCKIQTLVVFENAVGLNSGHSRDLSTVALHFCSH